MEIYEKLLKPVTETRYLTVDNVDRYRPIIRLFYMNYEKMKYWMYQEEVYESLQEDAHFSEYTMEQCQQDLSALTAWGNLLTIQDTRKVTSIEAFKNKKFRYQLSEYAVEIERMVVRLENLFIEGASLEPTLLERIRLTLTQIDLLHEKDEEHLYGWWSELNNDFIRLNQNYQDYMRELNSIKAEEMMKTKEFLIFKDRLIDYLRGFVKSLQLNVTMIEQRLKQMDPAVIESALNRIVRYEKAIPRLDLELKEAQIRDKVYGRWMSIQQWFLGTGSMDSEAGKIFDTTNEIIRKITRYASRISEMSSSGANRREEYYKLAVMFGRCEDMRAAHRLSANVFGIEKPIHLKGNFVRATDSINSGVFEEDPMIVTVVPRIRNYREKSTRTGIVDRSKEKAAMRERSLKKLEEERKLLAGYIQGNRLDFANLPVLEPQVRDAFLVWLSKALERKDCKSKTEDGRLYQVVEEKPGETCLVMCTDGSFQMPAFSIIFEEVGE